MVTLPAIVLFASAAAGQHGAVLLDFTASWCGPCQQMRPAIDQLKAAGYPIREVDFDQRKDLVQQFRITEVPTFVLVADGRVIARRSGASSRQQLAGMFTALRPSAGRTQNVAGRGPIMPNPNPPMLEAPPLDPPATRGLAATTNANAPAGATAGARTGFDVPAQTRFPNPIPSNPSMGMAARPQTAPFRGSATAAARASQESAVAIDTSPRTTPFTPPSPTPDGPRRTAAAPTQFTSAPVSSYAPAPAPSHAAAPGHAPATISPPSSGAGDSTAERIAMHSSVRIEVRDADGASFATGTIVDRHGAELLVLTCGHVFKSSQGQGQILVDTFYPGGGQDLPGQLVAWEVKDRDVGLISFRPRTAPAIAPLATQKTYRKGDLVFTIGCDHGADPTLQLTKITSIDRYHGASNIEIAGQPVDGRSGGGLFTSRGELIGVCNAADPTDDEGIYAALPAIQKHLSANGMRHLVTGQPASRQTPRPTQPPQQGTIAQVPGPRTFSDTPPARNISRNGSSIAAPGGAATNAGGDVEVIVVIRPANGREKVMTIQQPSRDLLQQMQQESRDNDRPDAMYSASNVTPIIRGQNVR